MEPASPSPLPIGIFSKYPWWPNTPAATKKMMKHGAQLIISYQWTTLYPNRVTMNVPAAMMIIPTALGMSELTARIS
jgi:hypothetical protein